MEKQIKIQNGVVATKQGNAAVTTLDLINVALNNAPEKGLSIADFRNRARLDRHIEEQSKSLSELPATNDPVYITLDNQDFETLKEAVMPVRWTITGKIVSDFVLTFDEPEAPTAKVVSMDANVKGE